MVNVGLLFFPLLAYSLLYLPKNCTIACASDPFRVALKHAKLTNPYLHQFLIKNRRKSIAQLPSAATREPWASESTMWDVFMALRSHLLRFMHAQPLHYRSLHQGLGRKYYTRCCYMAHFERHHLKIFWN